jgi:uncharacterized protein (DUF2267 family)
MVATVAARAGVSRRYADEIILATLTALGERITPDETKDLLAQLPKKYKQHVNAVSNPNAMSADEFVARVAELEGERAPSADDARVHVRAVFVTLTEAVNTGELRDVLEQLSDDFAPLLGRAADRGAATPASGAEDVCEELERDFSDTFETMQERVDGRVGAIQADSHHGAPAAVHVGRDSSRDLARNVAAVARLVTQGMTFAVNAARDRAAELVALAVDGLEALTDRIDDTAEALQERVHQKVAARR